MFSTGIYQSLAYKALIRMGVRIAFVIGAITLLSYWHVSHLLEGQALASLERYVVERGERESELFVLAEDNNAVFKKVFLERLAAMGERDPVAEFDEKFVLWADGTVRNRLPVGMEIKDFDTLRKATTFVGRGVVLDADVRRRVLVMDELVALYGRAWSNRFINLYAMIPENIVTMYWAGVPWSLELKPDFYLPKEEFFYISDPTHNPKRVPVWMSLFHDPAEDLWMVSFETPIDDEKGRHIATVGHDVSLKELMERLINVNLTGAYNILVREDGRLIVHPHEMEAIKAKGGNYFVQDSQNSHLKDIFHLVKQNHENSVILDNVAHGEYLAVTRLQSTGWFLITVYPKWILGNLAFESARFILLLGLLSLIAEVLVLYWVLKHQVTQPLHSFGDATRAINSGNYSFDLDTNRQDELGVLARAFKVMSSQLKESFERLEEKVLFRTEELRTANGEISRLNQLLKAENLRMGSELAVTRELQRMVLPRDEELLCVQDLEISGFMQPANEVGGDYYDVLQYENRVKIGIGDVTGHGLASGVLMLMVQTAVRTLLVNQVADLKTFLCVLNRVIYENVHRMRGDKNLTLMLIDYVPGRMQIVGQHEYVLLMRGNGHLETIDTENLGFIIGIEPDIQGLVDCLELDLAAGDGVVLYTDGLTEGMNGKKQMYGLARLCAVVQQYWHLSVEDLKRKIIDDVTFFVGGNPIRDDITLLVIKRKILN